MMRAHSFSRADVWIFGTPQAILVVLPLGCWLLVRATQTAHGTFGEAMWLLACGVIVWAEIPADVFRKPLFDATNIGYAPHGLLGWIVIVIFWLAVSLTISLTLRYLIHAVQRRRHI
jgi:hypothetical protein